MSTLGTALALGEGNEYIHKRNIIFCVYFMSIESSVKTMKWLEAK
jgi:hypothetical protein